jgi:predicted DNA-binding WGR domain protein
MTEQRRYTAYAENKKGTNNKFYEVEALEGEDNATWIFRWGRIGTRGQEKQGTSYNFYEAKRACEDQMAKKQKRGYREVSPLEALASAGEEISERKVQGLEAITLVIPRFHAGSSEARLTKFCRKYNDKLNVIRASKRVLSFDAYRKQIEAMLKQYCAEFKRIKGSKTHAHNCDVHAETSFRIFFSLLKDEARCPVYGYFEGAGVH